MDKLNKITELCKGSVTVYINQHKDYYETAEYNLKNKDIQDIEDIKPDVIKEMIKRDTIIEVHFYPDTPVGFYDVFHYDLETALDMALDILNRDRTAIKWGIRD